MVWLKKYLIYPLITIVAVVIGVIVSLHIVAKQPSSSAIELSNVKASVSHLMLLPTDEEPTLATVQDKSQLKDKFLIDKAKNGDQLLIYTNNGIAILYRPSINKIVAVSPVTVDLAQVESDGATITILNGTNDSSKVTIVKDTIANLYPNTKITIGEANKKDFPTTIIIDNTGSKDNLLAGLMDAIHGKQGVVPLSEAKTATDFMIIVGKDSL